MFNDAFPVRANGTIRPSSFVKFDTSGPNLVVQCTAAAGAGDPPCGIAQIPQRRAPGIAGSDTTQAALVNESVQLYGLGSVTSLVIGGTVTAGDFLKSDASGQGITATVAGTDEVGAQAIQGGTNGQVVLVRVLSRKL